MGSFPIELFTELGNCWRVLFALNVLIMIKGIVTKEDENKILRILKLIYDEIKIKDIREAGLLGGDVGLSLFLYEYYKYMRNEEIVEFIQRNIDKSLTGTKNIRLTFCTGLAGLAWLLQYFKNENFFDDDIDMVCNNMDLRFTEILHADEAKKDLDFLHGSLGIAYYLTFRENRLIHDSISYYLSLLEETSIKSTTGNIGWVARINVQTCYNLGLAHGIPSILAYLLSIYKKDHFKYRVNTLINKVVKFILENQNPEGFESSFSSFLEITKKNYHESRLAWCYGDLGTLYILYRASLICGDGMLEKIALDLLRKTATRRDLIKEGVKDACFCHGSAGIMHLFNRLYWYSKESIFKDAAVFWLRATISQANLSKYQSTYKFYNGKDNVYETRYSILDGIAGVGLALLSILPENQLDWDSCLLLS